MKKKKNRSGIISALSCLHCRLNGWIQTHCFPLVLPVANWKWESNLASSLRQSCWEKKGVHDILDGYNLLFLQLYAKNTNPKIINHSITNSCNSRHPSNSMLSRMCALRLITYCLFSSIFLEIFPPPDAIELNHFPAASISSVHSIVVIYHPLTTLAKLTSLVWFWFRCDLLWFLIPIPKCGLLLYKAYALLGGVTLEGRVLAELFKGLNTMQRN